MELSQSDLEQILHYDAETGFLRWKKSPSNRVKCGSRTGCLSQNNGYIIIRIKGTLYRAHRIIWLIVHGRWPKGEIDHINGSRHDNRMPNLRDVSTLENLRNKGMNKRNKSGFNGVSWISAAAKWCASIKVEGKNIHLYQGEDYFKACCSRKAANIKYGFHKNHGMR